VKAFSEACERNRDPILSVLSRVFAGSSRVLEIGSGTGQHAAYFAPRLRHLSWQPSDRAENLASIRAWMEEASAPNLLAPVELDVEAGWPQVAADAVFSANTCHIMSWHQVKKLFAGVAALLPAAGVLALYGPFTYRDRPTAESNVRFDAMLRGRDPLSGLREFEAIRALGCEHHLVLTEDNPMPANNRLLAFHRLT
jgi:cyclopropane fatty-acyl-phospholipid synthase-like methyltransferase